MLSIQSVAVQIEASSKKDGELKKCGFLVPLKNGLNIVTGNNTSGKSTILSCIYYCLGLEQLLGGKHEKALDNSLRIQFNIEDVTYHVNYSAAQVAICNGNGTEALLLRKITANKTESESQKIYITIEDKTFIKFIHSAGDTLRDNGFFNWLEGFIGVSLPTVATFEDKDTKLYFQNIFSGIFVEQKKGWSDYFSTSPTFAIKDVKQKIFEFLLNLTSLEKDFQFDRLKSQITELRHRWDYECDKFLNRLSQYDATATGIPKGRIVTSAELKNDLRIFFRSEDGKSLDRERYTTALRDEIGALESDSATKSGAKSDAKIEILQKEIVEIENNLEDIKVNAQNEIAKVTLFREKVNSLTRQIQELQDLRKIKDESLFNAESLKHCPLCHASLVETTDDIRTSLDEETIQQSIALHKSELELYKSYLKSTNEVQGKLSSYSDYYKRILRDKKFKLQMAFEDSKSDSRLPSKHDIAETVLLKHKLDNADAVETLQKDFLDEIAEFAKEANEMKGALLSIEHDIEKDNKKIKQFKNKFLQLLTSFGYTSQNINMIDIDSSEPYKLLPTIKIEGQKESLRTTSSASDFVRVLWAYYLALLLEGNNHPRILMFDEPGQHAMMLGSLQVLVETCSQFEGFQIILAISKDKPGQKDINLDDILQNVPKEKLNKYYISEDGKCIHERPPQENTEDAE
jgi:hypothetical protein